MNKQIHKDHIKESNPPAIRLPIHQAIQITTTFILIPIGFIFTHQKGSLTKRPPNCFHVIYRYQITFSMFYT